MESAELCSWSLVNEFIFELGFISGDQLLKELGARPNWLPNLVGKQDFVIYYKVLKELSFCKSTAQGLKCVSRSSLIIAEAGIHANSGIQMQLDSSWARIWIWKPRTSFTSFRMDVLTEGLETFWLF